ncbi:MAG TPA: aminomethyltransferase beta-barrel domain-containing protein, partial [Polyangiaceae bacterium]|nr:aminomethyltransferase beta-barrel domain-containing protein [Polyangiaceae bacterium]
SPCVSCNRGVKIKELISLADKLGATRIATGHYARLVSGTQLVNGMRRVELWRAKDLNKDQSYFLHMLGQETLARLMFPLGELSKAEVRSEAVRLNLPGALKGESQELCFVPAGRYDAFVSERAEGRVRPGAILNEQGQVIGQHQGIHHFTVGQRRNLGVATGQRSYVTKVDTQSGAVQLGSREDLLASGALLKQLSLAQGVGLPMTCEVSVRYRGQPVAARVESLADGGARVDFASPVQAVVPGQVAVFYGGSRVLGGGSIERALPLKAGAPTLSQASDHPNSEAFA